MNDWDRLTDEQFMTVAMYYRWGKKTTLQEHTDNRDYIRRRLQNLGYTWTEGCCGQNTIMREQQ